MLRSTGSVLPIWQDSYIEKKLYLQWSSNEKVFFKINEAVDLVEFALKYSNKFKGKQLKLIKIRSDIGCHKVWIKILEDLIK